MDRRQRWQQILDAEVQRLSAMPYQELIAALHEADVYEVERDGDKYQVEVSILENTERYVHVAISVDDAACRHRSFRQAEPLGATSHRPPALSSSSS